MSLLGFFRLILARRFRSLLGFFRLLLASRWDCFGLIWLLVLFKSLELLLELRNFFLLFSRNSLQLFVLERKCLNLFLVFCFFLQVALQTDEVVLHGVSLVNRIAIGTGQINLFALILPMRFQIFQRLANLAAISTRAGEGGLALAFDLVL